MDTQRKGVGRPPVEIEKVNECRKLLQDGKKPPEISEKTGLGLTKIYEIRRSIGSRS